MGEIPLQIPKLRSGNRFPSFLEPTRRAERALLAVTFAIGDHVLGLVSSSVSLLVLGLVGLRFSLRSERGSP